MIPLFGKNKKKNKLFGGSVTPDCRYCQHNSAEDGEAVCCAVNQDPGEDCACREFSYDPLRRTPENLPPLPKFDPEDFSL